MSFVDAIRMASIQEKRVGFLSRLGVELRRLLLKMKPAVFTRSRTLRVEERLALGPKKSLTIICCRGERFLVASGADTITAVLPLLNRRRRVPAARKGNGRRS